MCGKSHLRCNLISTFRLLKNKTKCNVDLFERSGNIVHNTIRTGNVLAMIDVKVTPQERNIFITRISSKWFMKSYVLSDDFPLGTKARRFEHYEVDERLFNSIYYIVELINQSGRFQVICWVKHGEVED